MIVFETQSSGQPERYYPPLQLTPEQRKGIRAFLQTLSRLEEHVEAHVAALEEKLKAHIETLPDCSGNGEHEPDAVIRDEDLEPLWAASDRLGDVVGRLGDVNSRLLEWLITGKPEEKPEEGPDIPF